MKTRRILLVLIIFSMILSSVSASMNLWLGASLAMDTDYISEERKPYYSTYYENYQSLEKVNRIGPSIEISYMMPFFPYIGLHLESRTLFPVGALGTDSKMVISRHFDYAEKILPGIIANIPLNDDYGFLLEFTGDCTFNRISTTNNKNDKNTVEYHRYEDYGLAGTFGIYANNDDYSYFRLGLSYAHSLTSNQWNTSMTLSGGFIF